MKKSTSIAIIIAAVFTVIGFALIFFSVAAMDFEFSGLNEFSTVTDTYEFYESFDNVRINTEECDVIFLPSGKGNCEVVIREDPKVKHRVEVRDNTLEIDCDNNKKWYDYIGIFWGKTDITVYLPEESYGNVRIDSHTGDVEIKGFSFDSLSVFTATGDVVIYSPFVSKALVSSGTGDVTASCSIADTISIESSTGDISVLGSSDMNKLKILSDTGSIKIAEVKVKALSAEADTGDVSLKRVLVDELMTIETDTGDVDISLSDAGEIKIETDTGDVDGTLLSDKLFLTETSTGDIRVPNTADGGICDIKTDTGDIKIAIK